jgi:sulfatase modifying factor 1
MTNFELPDRYELQGRLGSGSYGDVFVALDRKLDRKVAIKLMKGANDPASIQSTADAFRREAKLLALLDNVHIVKIFDYDVAANGALFLVMEHLDGRVVSDLPLPMEIKLVSQFVVQIGSALQSAHDRGLIHRDLKPGNVMYISHDAIDSRFVLLDLGIAKLMHVAQKAMQTQCVMTFSGHGTPLYMAPEQVDEGEIDPRTDVYAFGSTLFELLTGSAPFGHINGTPYTVIKAVMSQVPRRLSEVAPHQTFPQGLEELIDECLCKEVEERPATMRQVVERFQAIIARSKNTRSGPNRIPTQDGHRSTLLPGGEKQADTDSDDAMTGTTVGSRDSKSNHQLRNAPKSSPSSQPKWSQQPPRKSWAGSITWLLIILVFSAATGAAVWNWDRLQKIKNETDAQAKVEPSVPAHPEPATEPSKEPAVPPRVEPRIGPRTESETQIALDPIPEQTIPELAEWTYLAKATLPAGWSEPLKYSFHSGQPAGMEINGESGELRWTPSEEQGPGSYPIIIEVESSRDGVESIRHREFTVNVDEVNTPPQLGPSGELIFPAAKLDITIPAEDSDVPKQPLKFSLGDGTPTEVQLDEAAGRLQWAPTAEQVGRDFQLSLRVTDTDDASVAPVEATFKVTFLKETDVTFPERMKLSPVQVPTVQNSIGMEFVLLEPATFAMGSSDNEPDRQKDEALHTVQLSHLLLFGRHEATVGQFKNFIKANPDFQTDAEKAEAQQAESEETELANSGAEESKVKKPRTKLKTWRDAFESQTDEYPVVNVSREDAQAFCNWLSQLEGKEYRLPTEAEWEYAARAGAHTRFFGGNGPEALEGFANLLDQSLHRSLKDQALAVAWNDGFKFTAPVGKFHANAHGIHDMAGNVWEWCSDWYAPEYNRQPPILDPTGAESGDLSVIRGGSWLSQPRDARSAARDARPATAFQNNIGFRVVRVP